MMPIMRMFFISLRCMLFGSDSRFSKQVQADRKYSGIWRVTWLGQHDLHIAQPNSQPVKSLALFDDTSKIHCRVRTLPYQSCAPFITTRKRSLQRLCFYTCLSVILLTGRGACPIACWDTLPGQVSPWWLPSGRYTPQAGTLPGQVHPSLRSVCWDTESGMQSCYACALERGAA